MHKHKNTYTYIIHIILCTQMIYSGSIKHNHVSLLHTDLKSVKCVPCSCHQRNTKKLLPCLQSFLNKTLSNALKDHPSRITHDD